VRRYRSKISGPLLDRIDMSIEVPNIPQEVLLQTAPEAETSALVRERVRGSSNARASPAAAWAWPRSSDCRLRAGDRRLFGVGAIERLGLSPRAAHRILRVARTVADLAGLEIIETPQLTEAITYRRLGRKTGS
jgi:magnesium chelatase family protein